MITPLEVAIAALTVSTLFNVATIVGSRRSLRLAQDSYARTEERYSAERVEARNDKLRAALLDVSKVVNGPWFNACVQYEAAARRLGRLLDGRPGNYTPEQVGAALAALTKVSEEKLNPAIGDDKTAFKNLRFLSEGLDDLARPLQMLAVRLGENVPEPSPSDMPTEGSWFLASADAAAEERDAVTRCDMALFGAAMRFFNLPGTLGQQQRNQVE